MKNIEKAQFKNIEKFVLQKINRMQRTVATKKKLEGKKFGFSFFQF